MARVPAGACPPDFMTSDTPVENTSGTPVISEIASSRTSASSAPRHCMGVIRTIIRICLVRDARQLISSGSNDGADQVSQIVVVITEILRQAARAIPDVWADSWSGSRLPDPRCRARRSNSISGLLPLPRNRGASPSSRQRLAGIFPSSLPRRLCRRAASASLGLSSRMAAS